MQRETTGTSAFEAKDEPDRALRILFITRKWPPAVGGMETYAVELSRALKEQGHEVEVIALPGRPDGSAPGALALLTFGIRSSLRLLTRRGAWDAVHGGDMAIWPLVWIAAIRCNQAPVLSLSAHGTDVSFASHTSTGGWFYNRYLALALRAFPKPLPCIAANSDATAGRLRNLGFADTRTIPLGCRVPEQEMKEETPGEILFAGRLVTRKGLSWFVQSVLPRLPEDMYMTVCGTRWDASEDVSLDHPRVAFEGPLPQEILWARMSKALAVVLPNRRSGTHKFEGFGLVAAEAAAAGGLVLAARLDGLTSSVLDGETGRLLPPEEEEAWVGAILELAALLPEDRAARRRRAAEAARRYFSWGRVATQTAKMLHGRGR